MIRVIFEPQHGQRVPVRLWARWTTPETVRQLQRLASQPYVVEHVAGMADAHLSEGVAVGSVFATQGVVVPRALGGDLGCGMSARRIAADASALNRRSLEAIVAALGRAIPTGEGVHRGRGVDVPDALVAAPLSTGRLEHAREALARRHLGTLGGGNHFLELDRDADGGLWLLVHSGSRGLGAAIAAHHAGAAAAGGPDVVDGLAGLPIDTPAGDSYLRDLTWALDFARANRERLAERAIEVLAEILGDLMEPESGIDIHHNFVAHESWQGRDLLVHRKGAVSVPAGTPALIPGSMGSASYVVEGLGESSSFGSCSHGAGRVMTRTEARSRIRPAALAETMRRVAYPAHLLRRLVDEAPSAYRDIREVLEDQQDLVRRRIRLEPIAVLKG